MAQMAAKNGCGYKLTGYGWQLGEYSLLFNLTFRVYTVDHA